MQAVRHLLAQRHLALWLCAATLILRLVVPTGYMIDVTQAHVAVIACPGVTAPSAMPFAGPGADPDAAMPMMHHAAAVSADPTADRDHPPAGHERADMPCAFAGLSAAMLAALDPLLLAGLIAFILRRGLGAARIAIPTGFRHAWPPLRGPPARA